MVGGFDALTAKVRIQLAWNKVYREVRTHGSWATIHTTILMLKN